MCIGRICLPIVALLLPILLAVAAEATLVPARTQIVVVRRSRRVVLRVATQVRHDFLRVPAGITTQNHASFDVPREQAAVLRLHRKTDGYLALFARTRTGA